MVILLFFCSGATALIYEVLWSKYLTLMFGSTTHAQTVVLAVFMGGLAAGNRIFGRLADRAPQPLAVYGRLELGIGLYAFVFAWLHQLAEGAFLAIGSKLASQGPSLLLLKAVLSLVLLSVPTILMGGTLPVLAAWLQRRYPDASRWSARFYAVNSLGAVLGAGLAGFFLVRWLGMVASLQAAALVNVMIGFAALGLSRTPCPAPSPETAPRPAPPGAQPEAQPAGAGGTAPASHPWLGCVLVAATGGISMGLEVLSARALLMIFGTSLQAFAIVLMAFILGIGLGSSVVASPRVRHWPRETTTCCLLLLAGTLVGGYVAGLEQWVTVYRYFQVGLARNYAGYVCHLAMNSLLALGLLGLPAALIGATLPLWIREGDPGRSGLGDSVGRLLTWNTLGAVLGTLAAGFILMPALGLRAALTVLAMLLVLGSGLLAWATARRKMAAAAAAAGLFLAWVAATGGEGWKIVLSSGVFRAREKEVDPRTLELRKQVQKLLFYEDATDATVSVEQSVDKKSRPDDLCLRINGKPDASSLGDLSTQYLLAHLPIAARPDSQDIFVLGFGSGITAGALLGHPIRQLVVAENCAAVLRAGHFFAPWNRGVLTNQLTRLVREDARTVLKLSPQAYDVIICEPSNPWTAGIGSVFSREFFELAASRLKPGGIMAQWFHVYEMNDQIVGLVLRTFASVFPSVEIWDTSVGDIVLLGSQKPWPSRPADYARLFAREASRQDLEAIGIATPEALWARQLASQRTAFAIAGDGPLQTDEFPILEYAAPLAFFIGARSLLLEAFDERTWQSSLAPEGKNRALAALPGDTLGRIFQGNFASCNVDLNRHLQLRFKTNAPPDHTDVFYGPVLLPCVFRPDSHAALAWQPALPEDELENRLALAGLAVQQNTAQKSAALDEIETILRQFLAAPGAKTNSWSPTAYIVLAAQAHFAAGHLDRAAGVMALGRPEETQARQWIYLNQVLAREKQRPAAPPNPK